MAAAWAIVSPRTVKSAAELLAQARSAWRGTLVALFQPAEEVAGGAKAMVDDGLRNRIPKPDVAFAQHVLAFPAGSVGTQTGPVLSAGDSIRITLHGKGAHGSMPHNSVDTVVLAYGARAVDGLFTALEGRVHDVVLVGDAMAPRLLHDALLEGTRAARRL